MVNKGINFWPKEQIPDDATLYMRVHKGWVDKTGQPIPGAFKNRNGGMSTDWHKYSSAKESLQRARKPEENGIIEMVAGDIRRIPSQEVEHTPDIDSNNRAHSDVVGEKDTEARLKFRRISKWAFRVGG